MLVLQAKPKQVIRIEHEGEVLTLAHRIRNGKQIVVALDAPRSFRITREELVTETEPADVA